ncbi:adenine deaminase [Anaerotignum faecicola]
MQPDVLKNRIAAGRGDVCADLVLKNARVINVFTNEIETADIAISGNYIVGVGEYRGRKEVDLRGSYVCPGLIDGHIHIESSMLCGTAFEQAVLPHGTTAIITDPHEISNVAGLDGLEFMLETTKDLTLSVYFMLPSCVPATDLDESGAVLDAEQLRPYYRHPRVLGLAELMNAYGTVRCDPKVLQKICDCTKAGKIVDGHAPLLHDKDLNAYIVAGVQSDHECSNIEEAMDKLRRGQYIMIREGTAAKNMDALMPLFQEPYCSRCMLVTDDKHPDDLLHSGHIDYNIRKAIQAGAAPTIAVKMATLIPAQYFGLKQHGAVAPGYLADLILVSDIEHFTVEQVYKNGTLVAERGKMLKPASLMIDNTRFARVMESFDMDEITLRDLELRESGDYERIICLRQDELLTEEKIIPFQQHPNTAPGVDTEQQIVKLAVFERHHHSGHVGIGFLGNFSLKRGAVASSISHDSHNLIVAGDNDADMVLAGNTVRKNKGGLAFVANGQVMAEVALPVAGLMSTESAESVAEKMQALEDALKAHGVSEDCGIFMTLAFVSLPVIPKLRLNTYGIVDVEQQKIVPAVFK